MIWTYRDTALALLCLVLLAVIFSWAVLGMVGDP